MGRVAIARVVSAIVAILLTWFGFLGVSAAAATSTVAQSSYAYDSPRAVVAPASDHFDRAPRSTSDRSIPHIAAVWQGGASTRLTDDTTLDPTATFTIGGELSQRAQASGTTWAPTLVVDQGAFVFDGSRLAAETAASDWPQLSGVLRDAARGKGNFGLGSATQEQAVAAGRAWVGDGFRVASDGKSLVSSDGLRVFRSPSFKPNLGKYQANFEYRVEGQVTKR